MAWRMRVTFAGKLPPKEYITPDIRHNNPGWGDETFNRPIDSLEFFLPTDHRIIMSGMEQYNFFVEAAQSLSGRGASIEAFWFCGKLPSQPVIEMWRVGGGKVVRKREQYGHEWGGQPTFGWKPGMIGSRVISSVMGV